MILTCLYKTYSSENILAILMKTTISIHKQMEFVIALKLRLHDAASN